MGALNLRQLILLLSVSTALLILANTFYTSYNTQRTLLIEQTLEVNHAYAAKTADSVNNFLLSAQQQLLIAAQDVVQAESDPKKLAHIVKRLKEQTNSFSSVMMLDAQGTALAISHPVQHLLGKKLQNYGAAQALKERRPLISQPYISVTDHLVVLVTHPVFDAQGHYLGFIGGSIYLQEDNILHTLLGQHYHRDQSAIYVVDQHSQLLYHQESQRIGERIVDNPVIERVTGKKSGSQQLINSQGIEMLAGYAPVLSTGWGVVAQRSLDATLAGMDEQMLIVARHSFPFFMLVVLVVWLVSRWIAKPLWQLARSAENLDKPDMHTQISNISGWYFEVSQLKQALLNGLAGLNHKMGKLNLDNITDPLTALVNRRGMQAALDNWQQVQQPFSVITGDIDHFKCINDQFGHDVGDKVLQFLAQHMHDALRPTDLACRVGGEEFVMLLPNTDKSQAHKVAERLRQRIESAICPQVGEPITLSFGVASWPCAQASIATVMKNADVALYAAKSAGRNRVCSCYESCE